MPAPAPLTVAAAQPVCAEASRPETVAANVARHVAVVREAGARLVVFPEFSLTGYDLAAPALDPADARLAPLVEACAGTGTVALAGAPVREADGREYIATLAVTGEGVRVVCRKIRLHGPEGDRFTPGDRPAVLELDGRRLGLAICADAAFPEHAEQLAALGIDAYVASTLYGDDPVALARRDSQVRDRTAAHGVWGVLSTSAGASGEYPRTSGGSGFWAPGGTLVAQAGAEPGAVVRHPLP
ncbi:carbon-nitrogen hydrolase family protein [Kitasatospora sp. RG8]|uniref:carbon-nitrogen hydrolase family protein n=1 Tax=Kitasatospora sp. RG8 TaxID=2820815 RepID=UPI001AE099F1|nr:carbon-nitrogen hydrolase family protein [Kitasatospora sp. RG8]MBP0448313.1 carbon-nitrogen hydrolase family protein [Kitasatospora sp. RG8]